MTRLPAVFAGCVVCAGLILTEFGSIGDHRPLSGTRLPATESQRLADRAQRRSQAPPSADDAEPLLRDARLTGIVIGPDSRIAIFAVTGAGPLVLSEGEALKDWRIDSISPERVVLSGPAGSIVLEPKPDASLVPPSAPVAVQPGQFEPAGPPGAAMAGAPEPPMAVTPVAVASSAAAASVQNYAAYDYPSYGYDPYPYFGFAVPVSVGFGFGFLHHHDLKHGGFRRAAFKGAAFHGGGFRSAAFKGGAFPGAFRGGGHH